MVRRIVAFVAAVIAMVVLGSLSHSLLVQEAWTVAAGQGGGGTPVALSLAERGSWILHDLVGLETGMDVAQGVPAYAVLVIGAFLIAFLVAGVVARFAGLRTIFFAGAGAVAIFVLFTAVWMTQGTVLIFGARGAMGLGAQMAAGLIAGLVFAMLSRPRDA